jgi:hypothetical protein
MMQFHGKPNPIMSFQPQLHFVFFELGFSLGAYFDHFDPRLVICLGWKCIRVMELGQLSCCT